VATEQAAWGRWDQDVKLLVLEPSGDGWEGRVVTDKGMERPVQYDQTFGLVFE
jgi:hypothetical protein